MDRSFYIFFFVKKTYLVPKYSKTNTFFKDFVRVLAHFRPIKKNMEKNKLNTRKKINIFFSG